MRKIRIKALSLTMAIFIALIGMTSIVYAENTTPSETTERYIFDDAGLLSEADVAALNERAKMLSEDYHCNVYMFTIEDTQGMYIEDCSEYIFDTLMLGYGEDRSSVMLLLSMAEREYNVMAYGYGNVVFTDYGKDKMADSFLPYLSDDDWYAGFSDYLDTCEYYFEMSAAGTPFDSDTDPAGKMLFHVAGTLIGLAASVLIAFLFAKLTERKLMSSMISTGLAENADDYVAETPYIYDVDERFTYTTTTSIYIPDDKNSGIGGGTTINSGGFSHSSGKF